VPNFVAMATGVGRGKMQFAAFDGPFPKNPYRRKNLAKIPYANRVIANFVPNFVAMATGVSREKCNWQQNPDSYSYLCLCEHSLNPDKRPLDKQPPGWFFTRQN